MKRYSPELKEQMVRKMMPPNNQTVTKISQETGISDASLYAWKKQFQAQGYVVPKSPNNPDHWDAKAKLAAVIATDSMNEAERSAYCRREHGLYVEQLDAWKRTTDPDAMKQMTQRHHKRWRNRPTRNWDAVGTVYLNPDKQDDTQADVIERQHDQADIFINKHRPCGSERNSLNLLDRRQSSGYVIPDLYHE